MNVIENSIVLQRPVEDVFAYINQFSNDVYWRKGVTSMTQSTPVTQVGTTTHELLSFMGTAYDTLGEVIEVVPNAKTAYRSTQSKVGVTAWRRVEAADGGTLTTMHTEVDIQGLMALFAPVMAAVFSRQMRADLLTLKRLLESR